MNYIYQFEDLRTDEVVYVGLTDNFERRMREHTRKGGILYPLAQELEAQGLELLPSIIDSHPDLQEARNLEKRYIQEKKPLLNKIHNMNGIYEQREIQWFSDNVDDLMKNKGFSYKESLLYMKHFYNSDGSVYTYNTIAGTAQTVAQRLGRSPFTDLELLYIAFDYIGVDLPSD